MTHYRILHKTPDKKEDSCECPNGHTWTELFYRYPPYEGNYEYADNNGSTCPMCGEQDIIYH